MIEMILSEKKNDVVFFGYHHLSSGGGCETYSMNLARWLSIRNIPTSFVTGSERLNRFFAALQCGSPFYKRNISNDQLKSVYNVKNYTIFSFFDLFLPTRKKILVQGLLSNAEVILSKNEIYEVLFLRFLFRVDMKKVVFIFHTPVFYSDAKGLKAWLHNLLYSSRVYFFLLRSSRYVVLNARDKSTLSQMLPDGIDIEQAPNPINIHKYVLKQYEKSSEFTIYFVGRFFREKGIDILATAITKLADQSVFNKMQFHFVGRGPYEYHFQELCTKFKNCHLEGYRADVENCYRAADVVVIPSRTETFCNVAAEAQASGVPVIASNISGPNEIIIPNESGWLIKPEDPPLLADTIIKVFYLWHDNFDTYKKYAERGRMNIIEKFSEDEINLKLLKYISSRS